MVKLRFNAGEKAQGMVEFALVLPILLLIIFGIIGFGHLFFAYTTTVNASREAARFGSAVGVTSNGIPVFQDCNAIINHAVNMGSFAGVSSSTVTIKYDQGDPATEYGSCLPNAVGPDVPLGNRIVVRINVPYTPIVPLVPIPPFNLQAETRRTIVRALPVGEAPTAEPLCATTNIALSVLPEPSVVGEQVTVTANVVSDDGVDPTNKASLQITDTNGHSCTLDAPGGSCLFQYWAVGEYDIHATYIGYDGNEGCWEPSELDYADPGHVVNRANTTTTITSDAPDASKQGNSVPVYVNVAAVTPGQRQNWNGQKVTVSDGFTSCTVTLDAAGNGSCPIGMTVLGMHTIHATYGGDANYFDSTDEESHLVVAPPPVACPTASAINFSTVSSGLLFNVSLPMIDGAVPLNVVSVRTEWPSTPPSLLKQIRFGTSNMGNSCDAKKNPSACVWYVTSTGGSPPNYFVDGGSSGWIGGGINPGETKEMRLMFSHTLPSGAFRVTIEFTESCTLTVTGTR